MATKLTIDVPTVVAETLQLQRGQNVEQAVKEVLAIHWYQTKALSIGQVAEFLGIPIYEAEGLMKRNNVAAPYSLEDFEHDRDALKRVLST